MERTRTTVILLLPLLFLPLSPRAFASSSSPQTQKEQESYSIGYQVGLGMRYDGVEVDFENLLQGLRDGVGGKDPALEKEHMKRLILDLKKEARESAMRRLQELAASNAEESAAFLEKNGKKEGVRTTESGLQYKVLKAGAGPIPKLEDMVRVNYRGAFADGSVFDSSYEKGEPQTLQTDGVIKGWTEALQMMQTGSKWQIFIPPHLAYGRSGLGQTIPPNKVLVFELELLSIETGQTKQSKK